MASLYIVSLLVVSASGALILRGRRRVKRKRRLADSESSLWLGLAAGLFDSADSPPSARLEIALAAIAKRLGMRGGLVMLREGGTCRVLACAAPAAEGLLRGRILARSETYCGSVTEGTPLVIDYASLSEWRKHEACSLRGWESFVGVDCGGHEDIRFVAGFFDTAARDQLRSRSELQLLEQMAPWIGALAAEEAFSGAPLEGIDYPDVKQEAAKEAQG